MLNDIKSHDILLFQMSSCPVHLRKYMHYYNPPGMSLWRHKDRMQDGHIPELLLYGDSHLANLRKWQTVDPEDDGPRPLDVLALKNMRHCSVGGSTFANIYKRSRNINVPKTQPDRGDQWSALILDKMYKPTYILLSLGSNDCDSFGQHLSWLCNLQLLSSEQPMLYGNTMIHFDPNQYFHEQLQMFISQLDTVVDRLEKQYPNAEVIFSAVFERTYWDELTIHMAKTINWYVKSERKLRIVNLNGMVPPTRMKKDKIHFRNLGYHVFMDKCIGTIYEYYYGPLFHGKGKKRTKKLNK